MPIIDTMSIPVQHRGAILNHRDGLHHTHQCKIWFPKNDRFGSYQTMKIQSSTANMNSIKIIVQNIVDQAQQDFEDYKARQAKRKARQNRHIFVTPTSLPKTITIKKPSNPFELLEVDAPEQQPQPKPQIEQFPKLAPTKNKTQVSWGSHLNHQHEETSSCDETPLGAWGDEE